MIPTFQIETPGFRGHAGEVAISFDPTDPFPLLAEHSASTYAEAQEHSRLCDAWLGLRTEETEDEIYERERSRSPSHWREHQHWIGLPVKSLLTPYTELREILERVRPVAGQTVVDFGAAYGRLAFVMARHFPEVSFIGYEVVPERVHETRRCMTERPCPRARIEEADVARPEFVPPRAEVYFIYDFGTRDAIEKCLQDLRAISSRHGMVTVVGRGRATRDAIERHHPWLSQVHPASHYPHYSIYRG